MQRVSLMFVFLITLLLYPLSPTQAQQSLPPQAYIRFAHFAPRVDTVDFYVDGNLSETANLPFTEVGEWVAVSPGEHSFSVVPAGGVRGTALLYIDDVNLDGET